MHLRWSHISARGSARGVHAPTDGPRLWTGAADDTFERLLAAPRLAVDTESDPFHRYFERVCLIQLSSPDEDLVFDPLDPGGPLPDGIRRLLEGEGPELVLHGAESDVRSIKQSFGLALGPLFDTQLAAQFLGKPKTGLKDLLEGELEVIIDKGEQRSDWGRRPLTDAQLAYARQDTQHLLGLAARLEAQLGEVGRGAWHAEECAVARTREPTEKTFDPESWRKIKGSRDLRGVGRRALASAVAWRDAEARRQDVPAFRIVRSEALLRIAKGVERGGEKALAGLMNGRILPKGTDRMGLAYAISDGLAGPDPGRNRPPKPESARVPPKSPEAKARLEGLKEARAKWAEQLGMDAGFLLPATLLDRVARVGPSDVASLSSIDGFSEWRATALGERILQVAAVMEAPKGC